MTPRAPPIAVITDVRFPGGTSSAVAQELPSLREWGLEAIYSPSSAMLRRHPAHPDLVRQARHHGVAIVEEFTAVAAQTVILHNPAFMKFEEKLDFKIIANRLIIVNHENPTNAVGVQQYPFRKVVSLIDEATFADEILLAPISRVNRRVLESTAPPFPLTGSDWFNIIDLECFQTAAPKGDRRGRHSRPGPEKWPKESDLTLCFPPSADNHILGADWIRRVCPSITRNAALYDYGTVPVAEFLDRIDFFVYFHSQAWRESFGRVIAEAIAAGKLVIGPSYLGETFPGGGVFCEAGEVRHVIQSFVDDPDRYRELVADAQAMLSRYSRSSFERTWQPILAH